MPIPILDDVALARRTVLRRVPLDEVEAPPALLDSIERLFGARLTPAEAVDRIISDVRGRGDSALRDWTARLDATRARRLAALIHECEKGRRIGLTPPRTAD